MIGLCMFIYTWTPFKLPYICYRNVIFQEVGVC